MIYNEANIDAETSGKLTPLMIACERGSEEIASLLLTVGADINAADIAGNTALHFSTIA